MVQIVQKKYNRTVHKRRKKKRSEMKKHCAQMLHKIIYNSHQTLDVNIICLGSNINSIISVGAL